MSGQLFASKLKPVKGIMLDITGVLKDGKTAIAGSVDAVERLHNSGLSVRLCTNETTCTRKSLVDRLHALGFNIPEEQVFSPVPALCQVLKERKLRPHLLVSPVCLPDFKEIDQSNPNCVVVGDAVHQFSYENLNAAFRLLRKMDNPVLFAMGCGKYYQEDGDLFLDVGPFLQALEYSTGLTGEIVGKPSSTYFNTVLQDMGIPASEIVMVGDDIVSDVGGAQACGMLGVQVRTGKFRPQDEPHPSVTPDAYVDNLAEFVDILLCNISS